MDKVYITKSGWMVEYPLFNLDFIKYLLVRLFAFCIDFLIFGTLQWVLMITIHMSWLWSSFISYVMFTAYLIFVQIALRGYTLGMALARIKLVDKTGYKISTSKIMIRASFVGLFAFGYVGIALMIANAITIIILRGMGMPDVLSRSFIYTTEFIKFYRNVFRKDNSWEGVQNDDDLRIKNKKGRRWRK